VHILTKIKTLCVGIVLRICTMIHDFAKTKRVIQFLTEIVGMVMVYCIVVGSLCLLLLGAKEKEA